MSRAHAAQPLMHVFVRGVTDAVSVHRTLPMLAADASLRNTVILCIGANGGLFLGSMLLFDYVVAPLLAALQDTVIGDTGSTSGVVAAAVDKSLHLLYMLLWVLPIYVLVYLCSIFWYQDIADAAFKLANGQRQPTPPDRAIRNELYRLLVWVLLLGQIWLLSTALPTVVQIAKLAVHGIFAAMTGGGSIWLRAAFDQIFVMTITALKLCGFVLTSVLYGLYPLEYMMVAQGHDPDQRYAFAEKHWVYFLGFGCPYALATTVAGGYLMGYGIYAVAFPFCIMLGALVDVTQAYKEQHAVALPLPVFRTAQQAANKLLRAVRLRANGSGASSAPRRDAAKRSI